MPCNFNRKYENLKFMEIKDRKDIITLVDTFYKKVLKDELLGHINTTLNQ